MTKQETITSAAKAYEAMLVPGIIAPWAELIVSGMQVNAGIKVLDVACGTGIATRYAARRCGNHGKAVGIDIDEGMVEIAKSISIKEGLSIDFQLGSACELPYDANLFDAAICLQGLQYFPDRLKAMSEMRRVLRPNSLLTAITWSGIDNCKGYWALVKALENRNLDAAAARKPFCLSSPTELRLLAEEAGFRQIEVRSEQHWAIFNSANAFVDAMLQGAPSTRYALEKVSPADWQDFLSEVDDLLSPWKHQSCLKFPMEGNVLVAHR
ncbi:MAG: methyltransferase domain-containing protein [Steroidobacter sp.]